MRVLIIGDFSSVAKNLCDGINSIGHESFVISWGDGFKRIDYSEKEAFIVPQRNYLFNGYKIKTLSLLNRINCSFKLHKVVKKLSSKKWDVVLIVSPVFIRLPFQIWMPFFTQKMILGLAKSSSGIFLMCCGNDPISHTYWANHPEGKMYPMLKCFKNLSFMERKKLKYYSSFINKIIPVTYGYAVPYKKSELAKGFVVLPTIPMPINTSKFVSSNTIGKKIVIFHGINRPEQKGSPYIIEAMNKLQDKYPEKVQCIAKGNMPLSEYLELLMNSNIVVDQCYADSSGMNALYAMAMGKVVLGGNEPENVIEFNYKVPAINIGADSDMIFNELEKLVLRPAIIAELSKQSREYVEKVHDYKLIAKKYISCFLDNLEY